MKKYIQNHLIKMSLLICTASIVVSCSENFLEPDPLSFYEPETTFTTESGLQATLASCDKHLRNLFISFSTESTSAPIGTELIFSDMAYYGKTDVAIAANFDFANTMSPTVSNGYQGSNDNLYVNWYWNEGYSGIKYANTVLSYIDKVAGLSDATRNKYKGQAYFHRAYRYLNLVYQFGDIPLVTKLLEVPKQNYYSTKKEEIIKMITVDMEKAVQWVPDQSALSIGMVNKGACRQLLIKCYLASGRFAEAENQANILIDQSGYSLMQSQFGIFDRGGNPTTWNITRNVIWDLHRPENKSIAANREAIMIMPNSGAQSFMAFNIMRIFNPFWNDPFTVDPSGKQAGNRYALNQVGYDANYDYTRAFGRGIGVYATSFYAQVPMWIVNGVEDKQDLRHNPTVGNWVRMEDFKYNTSGSTWKGQNWRLRNPTNGALLCQDTLRGWYDFPLYKTYMHDVVNENNPTSSQFDGASLGSVAHMYLYRLAETYLLRAEARLYQGNVTGATQDVNVVRKRANALQLYTAVNIGDICAERGRELFLEEWRNVELKRISHCLAMSGVADEWGQTYSLSNWDKQAGTDRNGGSYWYQRLMHYSIYNKYPSGIAVRAGVRFYTMNKRNNYWPISNSVIVANTKGKLAQNFGYDGYDPNVKIWDKWEDAVADEDKIN